MIDFALHNGDLAIGEKGYITVSGPAKVAQDLGVAVREPMGCDRFHPRWGSILPEFVGSPIGLLTETAIRNEVARLVANYIANQNEMLRADVNARRRPRFSTGEVIERLESIEVRQQYDLFRVRAVVRTLAGDRVEAVRTLR